MNEHEENEQEENEQEEKRERREPLPESTDYSLLDEFTISSDASEYFAREISSSEEIEEVKRKVRDIKEKRREILLRLEKFFSERVEQMGINHKEFEITIPLEYNKLKFVTILNIQPDWILIKCKVMNLKKIKENLKYLLYEKVLMANFELNAVFYSVDPDGIGIWIENDITTKNLGLESFDVNFNAIIYGIQYFVDKIAKPLNQDVSSTFNANTLYT
ncbi:MAG: hypothetical protein ACTSXP_17715 [Promethearchaeota archaeon]